MMRMDDENFIESEIRTLEEGKHRQPNQQTHYLVNALHGKKEHPAVSISMKSQSKVLKSFKLLGLDASTRLKIDKNEDNPQSEFLSNLIGGKF